MLDALDEAVAAGRASTRTALMETALRTYLDDILDVEVVYVEDVPRGEAKELIHEYLKKHPNTYLSNLADALHLDVLFTYDVLQELAQEGRVVEGE